jgi:hypothetical protein
MRFLLAWVHFTTTDILVSHSKAVVYNHDVKGIPRTSLSRQLGTRGRIDLAAQALVITLDYGRANGIDITLKDGALDRVYGNSVNPDPYGFGPSDISHRWRADD